MVMAPEAPFEKTGYFMIKLSSSPSIVKNFATDTAAEHFIWLLKFA